MDVVVVLMLILGAVFVYAAIKGQNPVAVIKSAFGGGTK